MAPYYNIIYNGADDTKTEDSILALEFVEFLVQKLSGWGYEGYFAERDATPGKSIFDELFGIVSETEKTIVVITPEFETNFWAKFSKQAAFKYLIDKTHQHKLIPIAVNIRDNLSLKELNVNQPIHINGRTKAEWDSDNNKRCFDRLKKAFGPPTPSTVDEERGDNRLRTEVHQQFVTRPSSETSLSSAGYLVLDERNNSTLSVSEDCQSAVVYDRSLSDPMKLSFPVQQNTLQLSVDSQSLPAYDGDPSTADANIFAVGTTSQLLTEENPTTLKRLWDTRQSVGEGQPSSNIRNVQNGENNGEMSASRGHASISDDTYLSMDVYRSLSVTQDTNEEVVHDSFESRPETLGSEGVSETRPDTTKLSLGSFEQDDRSEVVDPNQTIPKDEENPESGYTTFSSTPSPAVECVLDNQVDDASPSGLPPDLINISAASPTGGSNKPEQATPKESGASNKISCKIGNICQIVMKCALNIDKAYQS